MMPQLQVNGVELCYLEQGIGTPVVFVHGAWMDLRYWEPQRQAIATQYRFIAYTLRYHGTAPWLTQGSTTRSRPMSPISWPSSASCTPTRCIS
jgi:pimeloyl-ACP methyl ester carboxylesterase